MVRVVVVAVLVAALISGCTSDPKTASEDAAEAESSSSTGPGTTGSGATGTAGGGNGSTPLTANLTADVLNGTAPLLVNFTIAATPASANATWTLSTNGTSFANGTGVPAAANHTFLAGGLWNVTLTVMDAGRNATALVAINVTGGQASTLLATYTNSGTVAGPYVVTNDPAFAHLCLGFNAGQDGLGCVFIELASVGAHDGLPGIVTTDAANFRFAMYDECSGTGTATGFVQGDPGATIAIAAGTGCIVAWSSNTGDWGEERTFTLDVYDWLPEPEE